MAYTKGIPGGGGFGKGGKGSGGGTGLGTGKKLTKNKREKHAKNLRTLYGIKNIAKAVPLSGLAAFAVTEATEKVKGLFATEERDRNKNKNPDVFEAKRIKNAKKK